MRRRTLKPISQAMEMKLIAAALTNERSQRFLALLKANPSFAKQCGRTIERSRQSFSAAYPGQTRTRRVPNSVWKKAGHHHIAALNEAMGLKAS